VAVSHHNPELQIYHISDPYYPLYYIPSNNINAVLYADENISVIIKNNLLTVYDALYDKEIQGANIPPAMQTQIKPYEPDTFDSTEQLISRYIQYSLIPITTDKAIHLYDIEGQLITQLKNEQELQEYVEKTISTKAVNNTESTDIIRLY